MQIQLTNTYAKCMEVMKQIDSKKKKSDIRSAQKKKTYETPSWNLRNITTPKSIICYDKNV